MYFPITKKTSCFLYIDNPLSRNLLFLTKKLFTLSNLTPNIFNICNVFFFMKYFTKYFEESFTKRIKPKLFKYSSQKLFFQFKSKYFDNIFARFL